MVIIKNRLHNLWNKLRNGFLQILGANTINKIVAVLSNMVIPRILSTSDYGTWTYVLNQYTYFSIVSAFGLLNGAFQFGAENRGGEKEFSYYKYCLRNGLLINLGLLGIGIAKAYIIRPALPGSEIYLISYIPVLILEYFVGIQTTILRCENRIKEYAHVLNINTVLIAIGTCVGALFGISGVVVGKYAAYIISLLILLHLMKSEMGRIHSNTENLLTSEIKELWHFSIIACISSAMNSLLFLIDVSMVTTLMKDAEVTATYKIATFVPNALSFIPTSVVVYILPNLILHNKEFDWLRSKVKKYYTYMGTANVIITITMIIFAPLIISIISGKKYVSAVPQFRILMIGFLISATFRILSANILFGLKKVRINMLINIIASTVDIGLNYLLISKVGLNGAAVATVTSETIASIIAFSYTIWFIYVKKQE